MGLFRRKRAPRPKLVIDRSLGDPAAHYLRDRLAARDWPAVRDFLDTVSDPDDRAFYLSVCADVDGVQDWIGDVVAAERHSTLPLLVRGAHGVFWAWQARGAKGAKYTGEDQFKEFFKRLKTAENCLDEVVQRDPDDTTAWTFLVASARGRQVDRAEAQRRFDEVVKRHPYHRIAHEHMLQYLCRKWFGSHEEMFDFARAAAAAAPPGDPLGYLVAVAHVEQWLDLPDEEDLAYLQRPDVLAELHAAVDRTVRHPAFVRRPGWPVIPNWYAFAFSCGHQWPAAAEQFDLIGDLAYGPWGYIRGDEVGEFLDLRELAYELRS